MSQIENLLFREPRGILSLTGAGGKTSLMFHFARLLTRSGKRVLTTTTTKIFSPTPDKSQIVLIDVDPVEIIRQASNCFCTTKHITAVANKLENGKLQGFAPEIIRIFKESRLFDWILVEADGAARRSLKAPDGHEPVIPAETSVLVAVAGLDVLGEPLSEDLVFRSILAGPLMGLAAGEVITEQSLARIIAHPSGSFKGAPHMARRFIFLNKADSPERCKRGNRVAENLRQLARPIAEALIISQALDEVSIHAVHQFMVPT